jgi:hypothetical protein
MSILPLPAHYAFCLWIISHKYSGSHMESHVCVE